MKKSIILLLISLFIFSINLNTKQTLGSKQSDTSITVASGIDHSSAINILDVKMYLNAENSYVYQSDISKTNTVVKSSVTNNHFVNLSDNDLFITYTTDQVINNLTKVQRIHLAKTDGLQGDNNQYFNIYLHHCTGKLGRT